LVGIEFLNALLFYLFFQNLVQFTTQVIQEQWVNDFVDVFDACVVQGRNGARNLCALQKP
jgi:hypothetical protein